MPARARQHAANGAEHLEGLPAEGLKFLDVVRRRIDGAVTLDHLSAVQRSVQPSVTPAGVQGLPRLSPTAAAGRVMLARLRFLAVARRDFAFETTLAGLGHGQWLRQLHASGYRSHLVSLALPSAALAVARVAERAPQGHQDVAGQAGSAGAPHAVAPVLQSTA
jgi:hypothetical protein